MPTLDKINALFNGYHSEVEGLLLDLVSDKIDKHLLDLIFSDLDTLQEECHDKLKQLFEHGERKED